MTHTVYITEHRSDYSTCNYALICYIIYSIFIYYTLNPQRLLNDSELTVFVPISNQVAHASYAPFYNCKLMSWQ